jgi:hypothetical protein
MSASGTARHHAAHCPAHRLGIWLGVEHDLLAAPGFGGSVDAFFQRDARAARPQPPAMATGQPHQHSAIILHEAGTHPGVEVKAHHPAEGLGHAAGQFHHILAAQIIAAFGQIEGAAMDGTKRLAPAIMGDFQPMRVVLLLPFRHHAFGAAAQAFLTQFAAIGIGQG